MLKVLFVPDLRGVAQEASKICGGFNVTPCCTITVIRKFIVLVSEDVSHPDAVVAIGPVYGGESSYYHREMLYSSAVQEVVVAQKMKISGGGYVSFAGRNPGPGESIRWSARFYDSSGDYGVFNPVILAKSSRQELAKTLGVYTEFEWKGEVSPNR